MYRISIIVEKLDDEQQPAMKETLSMTVSNEDDLTLARGPYLDDALTRALDRIGFPLPKNK